MIGTKDSRYHLNNNSGVVGAIESMLMSHNVLQEARNAENLLR